MWIYDDNKHFGVTIAQFDDLGIGYDLAVFSTEATLADYVTALDRWQQQYLADCKGCDSCCHERAPLGLPDYYQAIRGQKNPPSLEQWLKETAQWQALTDGAADITLAQQKSGACKFLDLKQKICTIHDKRPLVCHTHVCLPKSHRAAWLREAVINVAEDALAAQLLQETNLTLNCKIENYPRQKSLENEWEKVSLHSILPRDLWQLLLS